MQAIKAVNLSMDSERIGIEIEGVLVAMVEWAENDLGFHEVIVCTPDQFVEGDIEYKVADRFYLPENSDGVNN